MESGSSFVWTEREVELLLEYKVNETQDRVDWELC